MNSTASMDVAHLFIYFSGPVIHLYLICHIGESITDRLQGIGEEIYQINWYLLPIQTQKMLPFSLIIAEKADYLKTFGSIACTLEMFQKVFTPQKMLPV